MATNPGDKLTQGATMTVGLCAAALNFSALTELAQGAGYSPWLAWCYPIIVDAYGLTALRAWLRATYGHRVQSWTKCSSVFALAVSMASAGLHVFAEAGQLPTWAAFAVSTLPALMLGLAVHLLVLVRAEAGASSDTTPKPAPATISSAAADMSVKQLAELAPAVQPRTAGRIGSDALSASDEAAGPPLPPPAQLLPVKSARRRRGPTKRASARAYYDAEIGPEDRRGSTELGALLARQFDVHQATARQWVAAFRREDAAGLEAAS